MRGLAWRRCAQTQVDVWRENGDGTWSRVAAGLVCFLRSGIEKTARYENRPKLWELSHPDEQRTLDTFHGDVAFAVKTGDKLKRLNGLLAGTWWEIQTEPRYAELLAGKYSAVAQRGCAAPPGA